MKKHLLIPLFALFLISSLKSQCTFGSFPPTYTFNPGWSNGMWLAKKCNLASTATVTGLGLNALLNSSTPYRMAIYTDVAGVPGNSITSTSQGTMVAGPNNMPVATTVLSAGSYWIMAFFNAASVPVSSGSAPVLPLYLTGGAMLNLPANMSSWPNTAPMDVDFWAVINTPSLTITGPSLVCVGSSVTLSVTGANSYTWSNNVSGNTTTITPTGTTIYSVIGIGTTMCPGTSSLLVNIAPVPVVTIAGANTLCAGSSISFTANGAATYSWNTGVNTNTLTMAPLVNASYSVTGFDLNGCSGQAFQNIAVYSPSLSISGNTTICNGSAANLTVSGTTTYSWSTGITTATISLTPALSTNYTVTGFDTHNCASTKTIDITVNALPTLGFASTHPVLCLGETATITVSGVTTATWNSGSNSLTFTNSPTITTNYTVSGTNASGCSNTTTVSQTVDQCSGINSVNQQQVSATLFPNPGTGIVSISINGGIGPLELEILNTTGQTVMKDSMQNGTGNLDLTSIAAGLYYVILKDGQSHTTLKLVKE